ncbi:MAG: prepilin-type N-terminal cleavage/methylation domain-containing protein [Betaproteobacteria bacterium]
MSIPRFEHPACSPHVTRPGKPFLRPGLCGRADSGFTLIEMAIVLLILGLLSSSILKGQELIAAAKTKTLAQEFRAVQTALHGYQDRYKAIPGDHRAANTVDVRASLASTPAGMVGNGFIDGAWDSTVPTDESRLFWQHARLAGFLSGPTTVTDADYTPMAMFGSKLGISSTMQINAPSQMVGSYNICTDGIPGKLAKQLDIQMDDGNTQTGSVRVADEGSPHLALDAAAIGDGGKYIVCLSF